MSLRTHYPTLARLIPALPKSLTAAVRFALHLLLLRWWSWRLTRRLLFVCAVAATLLAALYAVENWRGRRAFAAVAREAAAKGFSLNLREIAQAPVPDEQNLAKIPLLDAPAEEKAAGEFWGRLNARLKPRRKDGTLRTTPNYIPKAGQPSPFGNRPADLAAFRRELAELEQERDQETVEEYLVRLAPLLSELDAASAKRPYLRYDYDLDDPQAIIVSHVAPLRDVAEIAGLQSLLALETGRPAEAASALALPLRLRSAVARDPLLISLFSAFAMVRIAAGPVWEGQTRHAWTHAELDLFATLLADDQNIARLRRAYGTELAWSASITLHLPQSARRFPDGWGSSYEGRMVRLFAFWFPSGWLHQNAAAVCRYHLDNTLASVDPQAGRIFQDRFRAMTPATKFSPYESIARMLVPASARMSLVAGYGASIHDLTRLAVALEKHFIVHGAYPASLAPVLAADPALAALHDPFDGLPYRYRRDVDDGFTLWGVGQNLRDDGGAFPDGGGDNPNFDTGDLVWRVPGR